MWIHMSAGGVDVDTCVGRWCRCGYICRQVVEALRSPDTGLPFLTRSVHGGLPEFTFIAADLVQWAYQHVAGLSSEEEAFSFCKVSRSLRYIRT